LDVTALDDVDDGTCTPAHCSLREALTLANSNADLTRIRITKAGTLTLTAALPSVVAPLELAGQGTATILSGDEQFRVLEASADLTLLQLAITAGSADQGGAVLQTAGQLVATDVWFYGNEASFAGGAISASVPVQLTRCRLADNALTAQESGPAGGAIYVEASLDVTACSLAGNASTDRGGAIYAGLSSVVTIYDSSFTGNSATTGGAVQADGQLLAVNSTFVDNAATVSGGGLAVTWYAQLLHLTVVDNLAPTGAGVSSNGLFALQNCVLRASSSACDSTEVPDTMGSWVTDGSCGAAQSGDLSDLSLETLPDLRTVVALAFGCQLIDVANADVCGLSAVQGKDQRGALRPSGAACDVGAFEW
jgi:CSLREA domain-containing protein